MIRCVPVIEFAAAGFGATSGDINTLQQIALSLLQVPYEIAILSSHLTFIKLKIKIYGLISLSAVWRRSTQNGAFFCDDIMERTQA
jgi:hypothetical protein